MELPIGQEIAKRRKDKQITQTELADFMSVSKASVSKWETGQSYPDITLLPLLAAFFDCSVDDLLVINSQLTTQEIKRIYQLLKDSFETKSADDVLLMLRGFIRRYYSCYPFLLQMGLFYLNHWDLLPIPTQMTGTELVPNDEEKAEDKRKFYLEEAVKLFELVKNNGSADLVQQARFYEAYSMIMLGQAEEVLAILGHKTPTFLPVESLIAAAHQQMEDGSAAETVLQSAIYQYVTVLLSLLTNYTLLLTQNPQAMEATYHRGLAFCDTFDLAKLHPVIMLNFLAACLTTFAAQGNSELLLRALTRYVSLLEETNDPYLLHGDEYFDQIESWIDDLDLGNQMPRSSNLVKKQLTELILESPLLQPFKNQQTFTELFQRLQAIAAHTADDAHGKEDTR
ncbi:helix-turn-helix domain-containing protein [Enterococcus gallinarum]|uniref:helix-turn-helix domain-containing protein n=1 Tax=Enterococcus gallinarum TaxID=1353 RepID=UPI001D179599|nr:helix-turn-helix transcriptional regulator [Enterococcus gallinarum]MCC4044085.1 helix-turn-helix domain-containing protein [Enterococcus gallinarum]